MRHSAGAPKIETVEHWLRLRADQPQRHLRSYEYIKPEQFDLQGRSVLVTGASNGIGKQIAISYAKAGASYIAIAARTGLQDIEAEILDAAKKAGKAATQVLSLKVDVSNEQSVADAAEAIQKSFGSLDIVLNNAGYLNKFSPMTESDPTEWWRTWEVNIKGLYLVAGAMVPLMLERKDSLRTVLGVSSIGANVVTPGLAGYQISKLASIKFSELLNAETEGIPAFSVHPGGVPTELASGMSKELCDTLIDTRELAGDSIVWLTAERRGWLAGRYVMCTWDMAELLKKSSKIEEEDLLKVRLDVGRE